jgi:hypothetical protein
VEKDSLLYAPLAIAVKYFEMSRLDQAMRRVAQLKD